MTTVVACTVVQRQRPIIENLEERMTEISASKVKEGLPHPQGASWDGKGTNFALFSAHARKVEVCLFDETGMNETARIELPEYTDQIFHGYECRNRYGAATAVWSETDGLLSGASRNCW